MFGGAAASSGYLAGLRLCGHRPQPGTARCHRGTHRGQEAAVVATVTTRFPDGSVVDYDGVFIHVIDQDGRVVSMRGYWDVRRVLSALGL